MDVNGRVGVITGGASGIGRGMARAGARLRQLIARNEAVFRVVHEEDIGVCESVQRGAQSRASRPGPLSALEQHNRTFAGWYATTVANPEEGCRQ